MKQAEKRDIRDNRIVCNRCHVLNAFLRLAFSSKVSLRRSAFSLHCELGRTLGFSRLFQGKPAKGLGICVRQATGLLGITL